MVGGSVGMSTTMVGRRQKISKIHWLKRPKKFGPENKLLKPHIWSLS